VKSGSELTLAGLAAVRITWITAFVVCVVSILTGLLSGTDDGGDSSQQFPGFAFDDGGDSSQQLPEFALVEPAAAIFGAEAPQKAQRTKPAAAQEDRSGRTKEGALGEGHSRSGVPPRSGSHPEGADGREPVGGGNSPAGGGGTGGGSGGSADGLGSATTPTGSGGGGSTGTGTGGGAGGGGSGGGGTVDDTVNNVNDTVSGTQDTVNDTVSGAADTVNDTVDNATDTVNNTVNGLPGP
jgi:hypothetical protein